MTEQPDRPSHDDTAGAKSTEPIAAEPSSAAASPEAPVVEPKPSRWERVRPRGRPGQVAAILVSVAAAIFIVGAIFVAGVVVGSERSGEHHGHGGGYSQGEGEHHRGGEEADGSGPDGSGQGDSEQDRSNDGDGPGQG
ncbi:MAG: hypothetical protein QOK02_3438 [Mycobacterium sp.]|jgi:hypothetical protein|nr:hypothetical protein [Mycobacterium sp.]